MHDVSNIRFEPIVSSHLTLLADWLERPHWRIWWGEPDTELGHIRDMVEGRDTTRPFLFFVNGEPTGYIQYWFIGHHQNAEWTESNPWLADLPAETIGIDLSIAEEGHLSRGIGSAVLRAFVEKLVAEGHRQIIIDPDPANLRAVRAYEKAGFRRMDIYSGRDGDILLMRYDVSALETA
ncbi:MAG: GNAT family N-acetyltransferase [Pseudomonadota bacterium]